MALDPADGVTARVSQFGGELLPLTPVVTRPGTLPMATAARNWHAPG